MEKSIIVKDGTSKSQLNKAIRIYEKMLDTNVLKMFVNEKHTYSLVECSGNDIKIWQGNVEDFIKEVNVYKMTLVSIF